MVLKKQMIQISAVHNFVDVVAGYLPEVFLELREKQWFSMLFSRFSWVCIDQVLSKILEQF